MLFVNFVSLTYLGRFGLTDLMWQEKCHKSKKQTQV